jgi:hypothetical protein
VRCDGIDLTEQVTETSDAQTAVTFGIRFLFLLHEHWSLLLDDVRVRYRMGNFYVNGVWLLHRDRDLIRDREIGRAHV